VTPGHRPARPRGGRDLRAARLGAPGDRAAGDDPGRSRGVITPCPV